MSAQNSLVLALTASLSADLQNFVVPGIPCGPDSSIAEFASQQLVTSIWKKFQPSADPSPSACQAALDKFLAVNDRCRRWDLELNTSIDELIVGEVRSILYDFWFVDGVSPLVSCASEIFFRGRVGPGASIGAHGTDFYTKLFDSPLSATGDLHFVWSRLAAQTILIDGLSSSRYSHKASVVSCSRLSFVPKTTKIARTICTEPSINMWMQLGFGRILEDRIKQFFGIDLATQPDLNRVLARVGSINGRFSTIDLESASDSVSLRLLEVLLPDSFRQWLLLLRSPSVKLPSGSEVPLHMVSSMGNGYTFPLQSIIFAAIVRACYKLCDVSWKRISPNRENGWAVFGDDIIVATGKPTRLMIKGLELFGFVVNPLKSYVDGPFRESCGADYYLGHNVRGVYCKRLATREDIFVLFNGLLRWSVKTGITLYKTLATLHRAVARYERLYVPPDENDDAGFHILESQIPSYVRRCKAAHSNGSWCYRRSVPISSTLEIGHLRPSIRVPRGEKNRGINLPGLYASAILGYIRGHRISVRQTGVRYRTEGRVTPRWDYLPPRQHEDDLFSSSSSRLRRFAIAWPLTW